MQEDFLHYLWKHKKLFKETLQTTDEQSVQIIRVGRHNHNAGPDFFNSQIRIGEQLWAGTVEIHIKSSDWYLHNHEIDSAYDNVILHVVWEHDVDVFRSDNTAIPTLELQRIVSKDLYSYYQNLFSKQSRWINCENDINTVDDFLKDNWLERLYFERLERKSKTIEALLSTSKNDWEAVLFKMLAKNFGLKVNGDAFFSMSNSFDFGIFRKQQASFLSLESLLFGQAQLLNEDKEDVYFKTLQQEYEFIKHKFQLSTQGIVKPSFFRLRPPNFPTIRLSQLANLYFKEKSLFSKIIKTNTLEEMYELLNIETSLYWQTHYNFDKESKTRKKVLTKSFIDLIIINTIVPLKFSYAKQSNDSNNEILQDMVSKLKPEKNSIVKRFGTLKLETKSALESQAVIQLKTEYCDKNKCLQCAIGSALLNRNM
jgi:hypothetical protein